MSRIAQRNGGQRRGVRNHATTRSFRDWRRLTQPDKHCSGNTSSHSRTGPKCSRRQDTTPWPRWPQLAGPSILTTNFDRLIERALDQAGVAPQVIASSGAIAGMTPMVHAPTTVIKLHGDYLSLGLRNTPDELTSYPEEIKTLLARVFDEYGLLVVGWSAEYDTAWSRRWNRLRPGGTRRSGHVRWRPQGARAAVDRTATSVRHRHRRSR